MVARKNDARSDTLESLRTGPLYADWKTETPVLVWIVELEAFANQAIRVIPFEGHSGLAWCLVEAACVSLSGSGVAIDFWKRGCCGWFPQGNALLNSSLAKSEISDPNVV